MIVINLAVIPLSHKCWAIRRNVEWQDYSLLDSKGYQHSTWVTLDEAIDQARVLHLVEVGLIKIYNYATYSSGHDIDAGGNCRKPGCKWFSDGLRQHND